MRISVVVISVPCLDLFLRKEKNSPTIQPIRQFLFNQAQDIKVPVESFKIAMTDIAKSWNKIIDKNNIKTLCCLTLFLSGYPNYLLSICDCFYSMETWFWFRVLGFFLFFSPIFRQIALVNVVKTYFLWLEKCQMSTGIVNVNFYLKCQNCQLLCDDYRRPTLQVIYYKIVLSLRVVQTVL